MKTNETHLGDLSAADLDSKNAFVAAQGVETAAVAIEALGKPKYAPAILFLRQFAGVLYDYSVHAAKAAGIEPKPLEEQERKYDEATKKAQRRRVN